MVLCCIYTPGSPPHFCIINDRALPHHVFSKDDPFMYPMLL